MEHNEIIKLLLETENGLSADEKKKLSEKVDAIYIDARIEHHQRIARKQTISGLLLILFALLTFGIILFGRQINGSTLVWLKGLATGYFFAVLITFPKTLRNHSKIAYVLKIIKQLNEKTNQ